MDDQTRAEYENQSLQVRADLKKWENDWAAQHGTKPGRNDIKQNPDIAQKYKQYNKIRDILAGKIPPPSTTKAHDHDRRKSKSSSSTAAANPLQTPSRHTSRFQTPRKAHLFQEAETPGSATTATPSTNRKLFGTPALPTSIGPTPQKDGRVLGIFDLLGKTPSKPTEISSLPVTSATPSKRRAEELSDLTTPSTKRFAAAASAETPQPVKLFGTATTPLHERPGNTTRGTPSSTRSTASRFSTPAFLRRKPAPLPSVDETDENGEWKVGPLRLPKKLLPPGKRGLSSVVADLRKITEEAHQDDEEAMREMEMEAEMGPSAPSSHAARKPDLAQIAEGDNDDDEGEEALRQAEAAEIPLPPPVPKQQKPILLSAFDDESLYDDDYAENQKEGVDQRGNPLRVFKKKGQKRTTRKVNMRPTRLARPVSIPEEDDEDGEEEDVIKETQFDRTGADEQPPDDDLLLSGSEFGSDDSDDELALESAKTKKAKPSAANAKGKKEEGVVKKAVRKVKATAHANFKRLKLKNNGAKGGPGHNSRFRRRRR
ncbi:putative DNA replication regulator sld-2 [Podospora australis]|uniref:DNA replication regulator SLD2 n=1 Tax=Podospora australis TaxID=1536484 RepID=A0AAN6X6C5_9PEZI|nr:putative DNA replication regulator sld-2 [Podospora australis]